MVFRKYIKIAFWAIVLISGSMHVNAQVIGLWRVVDDKDGIEKSVVEIYEKDHMYQGRVVKLLETSKRTHCEKCPGDLKGKPLTGMVIIYDLKITPKGGVGGKVIDPSTGMIFSCNIELESQDRLKLRGYLGTPAVGKTSYWNRVKS